MTTGGTGLHDCVPPPVDNDRVILGGLAMLPIACYGELDLVLHSIEDVVVTLNNVAHVPGMGLNLFSLHAVGKQQAVVINPVGVHATPGQFVFPRNDVGSQLPAKRKVHKRQQQSGPAPVESRVVGLPPIAAATIAPATLPVRIKSIDINDMHVSYAHAQPGILHETARQLDFRLTGDFRACEGYSMAKGNASPFERPHSPARSALCGGYSSTCRDLSPVVRSTSC